MPSLAGTTARCSRRRGRPRRRRELPESHLGMRLFPAVHRVTSIAILRNGAPNLLRAEMVALPAIIAGPATDVTDSDWTSRRSQRRLLARFLLSEARGSVARSRKALVMCGRRELGCVGCASIRESERGRLERTLRASLLMRNRLTSWRDEDTYKRNGAQGSRSVRNSGVGQVQPTITPGGMVGCDHPTDPLTSIVTHFDP